MSWIKQVEELTNTKLKSVNENESRYCFKSEHETFTHLDDCETPPDVNWGIKIWIDIEHGLIDFATYAYSEQFQTKWLIQLGKILEKVVNNE